MKKPVRRKKARRTKKRKESQRTQKLSREVREVYASIGEFEEDPELEESAHEDAWAEDFLLDGPPTPKRGGDPWRKARQRTESAVDSVSESTDQRMGRVISLASGACTAEQLEAPYERFECALPSRLAHDQQSSIAVGDEVRFAAFSQSGDETLFRVEEVLPRRTILSRPDILNPRLERVIAANVDFGVHVVSLVRPAFRLSLIDRYLIAIERGGAEPLVCVNKVDLLPDEIALAELESKLQPYRDAGRRILLCSTHSGRGIEELRACLQDRTAVFVGHSGVGKSSLINSLSPDLDLATKSVSQETGKGRHTTTRSSLFHLDGGRIRLIDTPGVREFGLWKLEPQELRAYFPDFAPLALQCRFNDCSHTHEPACAVVTAIEAGELSKVRYQTYRRILDSLLEDMGGMG